MASFIQPRFAADPQCSADMTLGVRELGRTGARSNQFITLSRTHFLYLAIVVFVVLPMIVVLVISKHTWANTWCHYSEMPAYERTFGFRLGPLEVPTADGGTYTIGGLVSVDPEGPAARSGLRAGDVPRVHHGVGELCLMLAEASRGETVSIRVVNVKEDRGELREITLRPPQ